MKTLKLLPTLFIKVLVRTFYNLCCLFFSKKQSKVTFASYRTNEIQGNLLYLYNELNRQYPDYHCVLLFKKLKTTKSGKIAYLFHMFSACYHLATSAYFFIDDFYFPLYVIKLKKNTTVIQVWHAAGAFKKFGYSTIGKTFGPSNEYLKHVKIHSNYSKAIVSSTEVIPFYAEAFNMSAENVLPLGIPRTDFLCSKENYLKTKKKLLEKYPVFEEKKIILYAPTFRGKSHYQSNFNPFMDFSKLKSSLGKNYVLILKLHPYMKMDIQFDQTLNDFIYQIDDIFNTEEILLVSDLLITDYSSIIFDYSILKRPIAFFANDLKEYISERDFYYNYEEFVPGPIFSDTVSLANWITTEDYNIEQIINFSHRFFNALDGKASERIIKTIVQPI